MAKENASNKSYGNLGFENDLWRAADALRSNMDAAEYKHVVLGLIFLKYISDAFEEQHAKLDADRKSGADPEDGDKYRVCNILWVPRKRGEQRKLCLDAILSPPPRVQPASRRRAQY